MILVELEGGLGNQLFQYAFARCLSELNQTDLKINKTLLDKNIDGVTPRKYLLKNFNIVEEFANQEEISSYGKRTWRSKLFPRTSTYTKESGRRYHKSYLRKRSKRYLKGYWQNEKYFKPIENILRKELSLKTIDSNEKYQNFLKLINDSNSVSIHFRRTDYVNKAAGTVCTINYYQRALELINQLEKDFTVFVFSDDLSWVKNNFSFEKYKVFFIDSESDIENPINDFHLMSQCKHQIIANSSYSWWAAWLNSNLNKRVIAPNYWDVNRPVSEVIPESWFQVEAK